MVKLSLVIVVIILFCLSAEQGEAGEQRFRSYALEEHGILLRADTARIRLTFYSESILRVDYLPTPFSVPDSSFSVVMQPNGAQPLVHEADSGLAIIWGDFLIACKKNPFRIAYYSGSGPSWSVTELAAADFEALPDGERKATLSLHPNTRVYGGGESGTQLNKRGEAYLSYNTQKGGYEDSLPSMNASIPFFATSDLYGIFFDNTYPAIVDIGASDRSSFSYDAQGGEITYYIIQGRSIPEQIEHYTELTGRSQLPPRWALGYIQSRYGYRSDTAALAMIDTMRQKNIPCDAIVLDLYWFDQMGDLAWNPSRWHDPFAMMNGFLSRGIHTIAITEPYVVAPSANFAEAEREGYFSKDSTGSPYLIQNWWACKCPAALVDLSNPRARSWWWSKYPGFMGSQMSGLWTDLGEPENHPLGMSQNLGSTERVHNIYNLLWAKTVYDGWESASPNTRVFNMTRSGFAGIQRYGVALWSGDVRKSFGGLAVQLPMLLTMGISGIGYFNSDIGGFCCGLPSAELYARWMEFGAFCPITRAHGSDRLIGTEPWVYGPEVESICRKYLQLRYRLLPYIYSMAYANMKTGLPLTWPLFFFAEPEDSCLWNESESYLWGNDLLISPVVNEGQREKTLYLPPGRWIDFETDQLYEGRQTITVAAPLDKIPVFVRDGSIIPEQPVMNYTDERPVDTLTLVGYASWQGGCAAYFDDGATLNYQNGGVAEIRATQGSKESGPPKGVQLPTYILDVQYPAHAMPGVHLPRVIDLEIHRLSAPDILSIEGGSTTEQHSLTDYRKNGGSYYDDSRHILYIRLDDLHDGLNEIMALGSKPLWK